MGLVAKILLSVSLLFLGSNVVAQETEYGSGPVEVTSDRLELDDRDQTLIFIGNAVAMQNGVTIYGDQLTVKYEGTQRKVHQVVADGMVRIEHEGRVATGAHAVFFNAEGRIILTGEPRVAEGDSFVTGQEITIFLNDGRSIVSGGNGGRVNAVFTPSENSTP